MQFTFFNLYGLDKKLKVLTWKKHQQLDNTWPYLPLFIGNIWMDDAPFCDLSTVKTIRV